MLMKLTAGLNFINGIGAAFTQADPKSAKIKSSRQSFCFFGICLRKRWTYKVLMKSTPGDVIVGNYCTYVISLRDDGLCGKKKLRKRLHRNLNETIFVLVVQGANLTNTIRVEVKLLL